MFLRKHLDEVTNQKSKGRKLRARTYSDFQFAFKCPKWTITGYNGPLRNLVYSDNGNEEESGTENTNNHKRRQKKKEKVEAYQ